MNNVWFTSDTHLGHENAACEFRGFSSLKEMDDLIIENWNRNVKPSDIVYHLGDFCLKNMYSHYTSKLNGNIVLILGNHDDRKSAIGSRAFNSVHDVMRAKMPDGRKIFISHFSHRVWDKSHHGNWHLFGHSHGKLPPFGKSFDVGVDANDFKPLSYEQVCFIMNTLPDNHDLLDKHREDI